ncbi:MAG TPA: hypothetical protein VFL91_22830 [Thermomicrobiales bacterium]|nr:hypothetical protein [Thermomicrobiales bacterium]
MDARKIAQEVGLGDRHTLGFSPLSAGVPGEWTNVKSFYLQRCANPLHQLHRVPQLKPAIALSPMIVIGAAALLSETIRASADEYPPRLATAEAATSVGDVEAAFSAPAPQSAVGGADPNG